MYASVHMLPVGPWSKPLTRLLARLTALRWGLGRSQRRGELGRAPDGPASPDGSIVTLRFDNGTLRIREPCPDDPNLSRRYRAYDEFLTLVALLTPKLSGEAHLHLGDHHPEVPPTDVPQLVFNRLRHAPPAYVVVPDVHFVKDRGQARLRGRLATHAIAWSDKRPLAFWRGSSTGGSLGADGDYRGNARVRLCLSSQVRPELLDARLGRVVDCHESIKEQVTKLGLVDRFVPQHEQTTARYLVSMDGWAAEWEGLVWKLCSGSTVLMVESRWEVWFRSLLQPHVHYVPVRADLSDLFEVIEWCRDNDDRCREIAERAGELARTRITFAEAVRFAQRQLCG